MNTVWHGDVIEIATESMVKVSKGESWSLHCEYNGEAQAACGYTVEREAERDDMQCECLREKKKVLLSIPSFTSLQPLCPPNPSS